MSLGFFLRLTAGAWSNQYTDTGWFAILFTAVVVAFILLNIFRAEARGKSGNHLFIRRIAGLNAIDEAVGRATEMGKPVLMVPGIPSTVDAVVMQALKIFSYVCRIAGNFGTPILLCCAHAAVYTVAQEVIRDVYQQEGIGDRYDEDSVRFISDRQFAFAAGVAGLILREEVAASFLMGDFFAESLIFAETANSIGAIQVAASTQNTQTPFFIAACDYVLIGDEFYAASAYLTRQPLLVGSLVGQDWNKILLGVFIFFAAIVNTTQMGILRPALVTREKVDSSMVPLPSAREIKPTDTTISQLFHPQPDPTLQSRIPVRDVYQTYELPQPDSAFKNVDDWLTQGQDQSIGGNAR